MLSPQGPILMAGVMGLFTLMCFSMILIRYFWPDKAKNWPGNYALLLFAMLGSILGSLFANAHQLM
jgi:hypothetical protein